jgi:outer membrane protein
LAVTRRPPSRRIAALTQNPTMTRTALRRPGAVLLLLLAGAAPLAAQQPAPPPAGPPLTLEQALESARARNPDLLTQRNDSRSARVAVREARLSFIPSATASGGVGYTAPGEQRFGSVSLANSQPAFYSSNYALDINYDLSGAKLMQPRVARAQQRATEQRILGYESNLVSQVRQEYLASLQAREQAQQAERELARTQEHERLARARLDVGAGTPLDLRRAEVERGTAEVNLLQRRNTYQTELLKLGQVMGAPLPADVQLTSAFALFEPTWQVDTLVAMALQENPNLLSSRASVDAARVGVRAARTEYLPSLGFNLGYRGSVYSASNLGPFYQQALAGAQQSFTGCQYNNQVGALIGAPPADCSRYDTSNPAVVDALRSEVRRSNPSFPFGFSAQPLQASLQLTLPLFNGYARERRVEEARIRQSNAELAVRAQELQLRTELGSALLNLQTAYRTAQLQEQVVARATEELRLARERFRFGVASSVEVTDAQTSLSLSEQSRIDAIYNFHKSLATLEALVGRPLR